MKTYILTRPKIDWSEFGQFCEDEGIDPNTALGSHDFNGAESIVEIAGRVCYMSFGKGRKTRREYLDHLIHSEHYSVLEHAQWSILITGISRSCSHELVRHRHFSFSQLSQRYVDHANVQFIVPPAVEANPGIFAIWQRATKQAVEAYRDLDAALNNLPRKEHRTAARCVLPNSAPTKIVVTGNARTWREFIQKRDVDAADPEIRALAREIKIKLQEEAPLLFGGLL